MATYTIPGSIDDTGTTDVTQDILDWIGSLPDGTDVARHVVQFGVAKTYRCDNPLIIEDRTGLNFDGRGSTIIRDVFDKLIPDRYHWSMERCDHIDIENLIIRGPNAAGGLADAAYVAALEFEHGFAFWSCTDIYMNACQATNMYGDWVYLGLSGAGPTDGVEIENCYFGENGRQGFGIVAAHNVEIHHNVTGECRRSLMDFEPNGITNTCDTVWIHHNTFGRQRLSFIASKGKPGAVNNITVEDNDVAWSMVITVDPPAPNLRNNWIIRNNVGAQKYGSPLGRAMVFTLVNGLTVTGNYQQLADRQMYLCVLNDCTSYDVSGNDIGPDALGQYRANVTPAGITADPTSSSEFIAPQIVGAASGQKAGSPVLTIPIPSGSQVGDQIIGWISHQGTPIVDLLDPGWTLRSEVQFATTVPYDMIVVQRTLTADDLAVGTFGFTRHEYSSSNRADGILVTVRSAGPEPVYVNQSKNDDSNNSNVIVPGATTPVDGCLVLFFAGQKIGGGTFTTDGELDYVFQHRNDSGVNGSSLAVGGIVYSGTGTGKNRHFSSSKASRSCGIVLALSGQVLPVRRRFVRLTDAGLGPSAGVKLALSAESKLALS